MATIDSPSQPSVSVEVEPTFRAMRITQRPLEYVSYGSAGQQRVLGHYKYSNSTSPFAFAANANVAGFRHVDASSLSVITRITLILSVVTAVTAQALGNAAVYKLTGSTADPTTNANTAGPPGAIQASRSGMSAPTVHISVASAAAGFTGVSGTNGSPFGVAAVYGLAALGTAWQADLYNYANSGALAYPMVLAANEGFLIQAPGVLIATGTISAALLVEWAEVPTF